MKRIHAFTLIELLVVIAILSILAAILFPVFAKARDKARQASCLSNEKQLGLAFLQYAQDNNETFYPGSNPPYYDSGWAGPLYPFIKSTGIFKCPSDPSAQGAVGSICSYAINLSLMGGVRGVVGGGGMPPLSHLHDFTAPASTVLVFEIQGNYVNFNNPNEADSGSADGYTYVKGTGQPCYATGVFPGRISQTKYFPLIPKSGGSAVNTGCQSAGSGAEGTVHTDGSNFLAADGHAKWLPPGAVSGGTDAFTHTDPQINQYASGTDGLSFGLADPSATPVMTFSKI